MSTQETAASVPGGGNVDDSVPKTHQRKDKAGSVVERENDRFRMYEGKDSVD